ncbi:MAG TPA: hypothetical protein VK021_09535 [Flavobacteriaceae bacterium]|nr:hypothetical protein [Flavobacteriaceae bacterium]
MQQYIDYLLSDIQAAHKTETDVESSFPKTFEEEMEDIERYISGEGERPLSYYTKLKKEVFPPADRLNTNEINMVLDAFITMLKTWNASIDFPEKMSLEERYEFLRNKVVEVEFTPIQFGDIHFDFCSGYAPDCPWQSYCNCLEYWKKED